MLGIGMQEIIVILVVALIFIGPKRLPELAKTLGKGFAEFRKAADDLQETVRMDLQKEKHEEFRQKYPDLVPDEDDADPETSSEPPSEEDPYSSPEDEAGKKSSPPDETGEPDISYNPDEIEGGDETEDNSRDA